MVTRKKTKFENIFSFKRYKRRFGHKDFIRSEVNYEQLKSQTIDTENSEYTFGSKSKIKDHLIDLRNEFNGKSELEYYHAELNVFLRREINTKESFEKFSSLWKHEHVFLVKNLNTRWLISAADSFIDHDDNPLSRSYAFSAVCLVNTCKLCETEHFANQTGDISFDKIKLLELKKARVELFDGVSAFAIGTDDTIRNMRWRLNSIKNTLPSYHILVEVFNRINNHETVYSRMSKYHTNNNTVWW